MSEEKFIRNYEEKDLEAMLQIFNSFAQKSFAVYSDSEISIEKFRWMIEQAVITLVLEKNNQVIGFGYISRYKPYSNFNRTGVLTYFILPEYTGAGLGTKLFNELILRGKALGITNYLANISSKNEQSLKFHEKHGFNEVGRFRNVATKFGELIDVVWVQKEIIE